MSRRARAYVAVVTASGAGLVVLLGVLDGRRLVEGAPWGLWLLMAAVVVGELVPIRLGPDEGEVAPSTTFTFALLLHSGLAAAILVQAGASLIADVLDGKRPSRSAFNIAQYSLSLAAAGAMLHLTGILPHHHGFDPGDIPAILVAGGLFFLVNTGLVASAVALATGTRLRDNIGGDLITQSATEGILLGLAPLAVLALDFAPMLLPLLALPMVAVQRAGRQALIAEDLAAHDALTGLPNRTLFHTRTELAVQAAARHGETVVVMLLDLDRFKEINDTLGHHYGDEVLRQVGMRLSGLVRGADIVARLGGDEFAVLLPSVTSPTAGAELAERVRLAIAQPFDAAGVRLEVGTSVGIASYPDDGRDVDTLMQRADVAMYQAKEGKTGVERYEAALDGNSLRRLSLAGDLRAALEHDEFVLHFQPKVCLRTGRTLGAEVLLRWVHPEHGSVSPAEFIPLAENTGLIVPLTLHVLDHALAQAGRWRAAGLEIDIAVNLSARTLIARDLPERVAVLCRRHGVPTRSLVLEVTESMVVADPARALPILAHLHALGVELSIDDFGTGYSSMEYLKLLPVSEVKIDRSFVTSMAHDARDAAIVACTVQLARSLGLRVVAEGVETLEVSRRLAALGCDLAQGYSFSRALPAAEFRAWVADDARRASAGAEVIALRA
ncbi:MAG: putative bifunctional diguanylate cyclase/phosphodiesterase [Solirubrobacteraceae bacterium]